MSESFNPHGGLIILPAILEGPKGIVQVSFALDTGARGTILRETILLGLGYTPALARQQVQMITASGVLTVSRLPVTRLRVLDQDRLAFPVIAHNLPLNAPYGGLLGLDFFRGLTLNIDFRTGLIDLS